MDRWQAKTVVNYLNLSTPLGLLVAAAGRSRLRPGPRGLVLASDYRLPLPAAPAFTVGNVVVSPRPPEFLDDRPALLAHEERHSWQYAFCLGLPMLPLYALGAAWSYVRGGDVGVHNPFERLAGLADGGYPLVSARERRRRSHRSQRSHRIRRSRQQRPRPGAATAP
jgi:hypothetical protein